jgi:hypothetical protein
MKARFAALLALALVVTACGDDGGGATGPDLEIDRRLGYAVIVDDSGDNLEIGFSADRDAPSGDAYDITEALWRIDDGPWNLPPVTCVGRGQRVEIGVADVQQADRPGLLVDRVVWISCLAPEEG